LLAKKEVAAVEKLQVSGVRPAVVISFLMNVLAFFTTNSHSVFCDVNTIPRYATIIAVIKAFSKVLNLSARVDGSSFLSESDVVGINFAKVSMVQLPLNCCASITFDKLNFLDTDTEASLSSCNSSGDVWVAF